MAHRKKTMNKKSHKKSHRTARITARKTRARRGGDWWGEELAIY